MISNVLKIKLKPASQLWIFLIMVSTFLVRRGVAYHHSCSSAAHVEPIKIFSENSNYYVRINNRTFDVTADADNNILLVIREPGTLKFLLYQLDIQRFICLGKGGKKLVGRRLLKRPSLCIFEEKVVDNSHVKYEVRGNFSMAFNGAGHQMSLQQRRNRRKNFLRASKFLVVRDKVNCKGSLNRFCRQQGKILVKHKHHPDLKIIKSVCGWKS